jgi:hypothetical protein
MVCAVDGVALVQSKTGRWVHVDGIPREADPDHEPRPVESEEYARVTERVFGLKAAAEGMLAHHNSLHPADGCPWAERLVLALAPR